MPTENGYRNLPRRHFSPEFKREVVELLNEQAATVAEVARTYELHPNQLFRWRTEYFRGAYGPVDASEQRSGAVACGTGRCRRRAAGCVELNFDEVVVDRHYNFREGKARQCASCTTLQLLEKINAAKSAEHTHLVGVVQLLEYRCNLPAYGMLFHLDCMHMPFPPQATDKTGFDSRPGGTWKIVNRQWDAHRFSNRLIVIKKEVVSPRVRQRNEHRFRL